MRDAHSGSPWRALRECSLGICTAWLVIQNTVLLGLLVWHRPLSLAMLAEALGRTLLLMAPLCIIPAAILCGWAISTYLARGAAKPAARTWEMDHGRTR